MEEISSHFRASLLRDNAARIGQFDIIFEKDLSQAFWIIFRIANRIIFVVFRPNVHFYPFRKWLLVDSWTLILPIYLVLTMVTFNWLNQQLGI